MTVDTFLKDHIWVPIVIGCAFVIFIVLLVWCIYRRRRHQRGNRYFLVPGSLVNGKEELGFSESLELSLTTQRAKEKENAMLRCQFYLRTSHDYEVYSQHQGLGWRPNKYWFVVKEPRGQEDFMLSMVPHGDGCCLPMARQTASGLEQLFAVLKHPYLQFIRAIDFDVAQEYSVVVQPFSSKGSLRDLIYGTGPLDSDKVTRQRRGHALSSAAIAKYGCQVLEALLFLKSKGFPPCLHLHAGNVIVYSRVCRLSGYEQVLLGLQPKLKKAFKKNDQAAEVILFGHMVYEMATAIALPENASGLTDGDYRACKASADVVELLKFIFPGDGEERGYPKLSDLAECPFFRQFVPKEIQHYDASVVVLPAVGKSFLKAVRRGKPLSTSSKRPRKQTGPKYPSHESFSGSSGKSRPVSAPPTTPGLVGPVPPPPPPVAKGKSSKADAPSLKPKTERTALLSSIRKGRTLKKTVGIKDRSAPKL
eukprot:m.35608 g.35608  ORF g.35608 m.35608 type:complete len:478 (+) comp32146_c0_seq2:28-1461(+)